MACKMVTQGGKGGVVVRAPLSHQLMWQGFKFTRRRHVGIEFVVGPFLCSENFLCGYSGIPLSFDTYISKFQIDMARMDTFKRFFEKLLMESFARPALRPKRSSARELNAKQACWQALRGVVSYMLLSHLPSQLFLSCHATLLPKREERCVTRKGRLGHSILTCEWVQRK